jgi:lysophospholipase L1-like esterase
MIPTKINRKSNRRRRIYAAVSVLLGLTLACSVGEILLRGYTAARGWTPNCYVTGLVFFVPHATAGYTLRPKLRLKSSTYDVTTNAFGLRGPKITQAKPTKTFRIVVLGGSSVFGYLVPDGKDSCRPLERLLSERMAASGGRVEVLNAGVPGYNMRQCRMRYDADLAALRPDLVILYLGWNDSKSLISESPTEVEKAPPAPTLRERILAHSTLFGFIRYRLLPQRKPKFAPPADASTVVTEAGAQIFLHELHALVDTIRRSGAQPVLSTQVMAANSNAHELESFLGNTPEQVDANRRIGQWITEAIRGTANEMQVPLIDAAAELADRSDLLGDAIHLTEKGHRELAEIWFSGLLPLLPAEAPVQNHVQAELPQ